MSVHDRGDFDGQLVDINGLVLIVYFGGGLAMLPFVRN
jgi:hypothetical protein